LVEPAERVTAAAARFAGCKLFGSVILGLRPRLHAATCFAG